MTLSIVILAAGQSKRMQSSLPKVLHRIAGKTLLEHVVHTTQNLMPGQPPFIVYGHRGDTVRHMLTDLNVTWVEQNKQLGTAHALLQAMPAIPEDHRVLILYGDVPLISERTLKKLLDMHVAHSIGIITAELPDPTGLGRIIRSDDNKILRIVEEKDATDAERHLKEINSGIYLAEARDLKKWLPKITNQNRQQEYYITDIIHLAREENRTIQSYTPSRYEEILGVNNPIELARLERIYQYQQAEQLMQQGTLLYDPNRFDMRGEVTVGQDVSIDINVILEGRVVIGNHCRIGPHVLLRNVTLKDHVEVKAYSFLDGAEIGEHAIIGPYARIRPGTITGPHVQIGNFIEIKNSYIGLATKIHHVGYIGDSELGERVNIGAGTITCNYDGVNKHKTIIGNGAFIGSNTELVAPLSIGENAMIGAGSTITRNAPAGQLTISRVAQRSVAHWQRKKKDSKGE